MLQAILDNYLLLAVIILLLLFLVPGLILRGRGLRDSHGADRRRTSRGGLDRRA